MAIQSSIITLTGKIGNISFYKTREGYRAREKGGVSKERIRTDPNFIRTRENNREFGSAATATRFLKNGFRNSVLRAADPGFHPRLQALAVRALQTDPDHTRGNRTLASADLEVMKGLKLNSARTLEGTLNTYYWIETHEDKLIFHLPDCCPEHFKAPPNATHFRLFAQGLAIDFTAQEMDMVQMETDYLPMELPSTDLSFSLVFDPPSHRQQLFVVGLEFFKIVAGQPFQVAKKKYNVAEVV